MNCEHFRNLISPWLDGELNDSESGTLQQHLEVCAECRDYVSELRGLNDLLQHDAAAHRQQAASLAERVITGLPSSPSSGQVDRTVPSTRRLREFLYLLAGLAAGFLCAWGLFSNDAGKNPSDRPTLAANTKAEHKSGPAVSEPDSNIDLPVPVARLARVIGDVSVGSKVDVSLTRVAPASSYACVAESVVQTGPDSRCELVLASGSVVRLNSATRLIVRSPSEVEIHEGQLFCNAPAGTTLNVIATRSTPSSDNLPIVTCPSNGSMWTSSGPKGLQVSSAAGEIAVQTSGSELKLKSGESVEVIEGEIQPVSHSVVDPLLATRWIHPLLIQKGAQDEELKHRVDAMLAQIGQTKLSSLYESEIRSLGEYCVLPLIRYLESPQSNNDPARRHTAARIISDLATTWAIGDLIGLLGSEDGIVRSEAASALQRLTEETHGTTPNEWRESPHPETLAAWKTWWAENHSLYPTLEDLQKQDVKENTL